MRIDRRYSVTEGQAAKTTSAAATTANKPYLSLQDHKPSSDAAPEGVGAPEIVISPEMLECGFEVLRASGITDEPMEADRLLVERIYCAMELSRRR